MGIYVLYVVAQRPSPSALCPAPSALSLAHIIGSSLDYLLQCPPSLDCSVYPTICSLVPPEFIRSLIHMEIIVDDTMTHLCVKEYSIRHKYLIDVEQIGAENPERIPVLTIDIRFYCGEEAHITLLASQVSHTSRCIESEPCESNIPPHYVRIHMNPIHDLIYYFNTYERAQTFQETLTSLFEEHGMN